MKDNLNKVSSKWEHVKHGVPQCSVMGSLQFLIYINDFPLTISKVANPILFVDDTSIIISNTSSQEFKSNISLYLIENINCLQGNLLTLNCDKTHLLQFLTKKHNEIKMQIIPSKNNY